MANVDLDMSVVKLTIIRTPLYVVKVSVDPDMSAEKLTIISMPLYVVKVSVDRDMSVVKPTIIRMSLYVVKVLSSCFPDVFANTKHKTVNCEKPNDSLYTDCMQTFHYEIIGIVNKLFKNIRIE